MYLHFQRDIGQDAITGGLIDNDLHNLGVASELLVEPLDNVGCS